MGGRSEIRDVPSTCPTRAGSLHGAQILILIPERKLPVLLRAWESLASRNKAITPPMFVAENGVRSPSDRSWVGSKGP
jgi:hypothetical protein